MTTASSVVMQCQRRHPSVPPNLARSSQLWSDYHSALVISRVSAIVNSQQRCSYSSQRVLSTSTKTKLCAARNHRSTSFRPFQTPTMPPKSRPISSKTAEMPDDPVAAIPPNPKIRADPMAKYDFERQSTLVFPRITAAVKSQPRSTNHKSPSWHEKILLYDPIVLEDFTAWLNTQGLTWTVRNTIKAKKPKGRPKKDDGKGKGKSTSTDATEAADEAAGVEGAENTIEKVEVPLEIWMVQRWCEAKSICCLRREGERGGPKLNY